MSAGVLRVLVAAVQPFSGPVHPECAPDLRNRCKLARVQIKLVTCTGLPGAAVLPYLKPRTDRIIRGYMDVVADFFTCRNRKRKRVLIIYLLLLRRFYPKYKSCTDTYFGCKTFIRENGFHFRYTGR